MVKIYKAKDGYRWRLTASNGKVIAESGKAYRRPGECKRAFRRAAKLAGEQAELLGNDD